jgi:hypothetical protein
MGWVLLHSITVEIEKKSGCGGSNFCRRDHGKAGLDGRFGVNGNVYFTHGVLSGVRDQSMPVLLTTSYFALADGNYMQMLNWP